MGTAEESTPVKPSKPTSSAQETPSTTSYPDWPSPMQAYYGSGTTAPPFFTTTVASSPAPHSYLWGGQHPLIPTYGTALPYPAVYPHGGLYAHPNIAVAQGALPTNMEMEGKAPDGKDQTSMKKSKGSSGNTSLTGRKSQGSGKEHSGSGNGCASQSAESGSEDSSDASNENDNKQEHASTRRRSFDQMLADGANAQHKNNAQFNGTNLPVTVPGKHIVPMPATNLNMGMDLWNASPARAVSIKTRPTASGVSQAEVPASIVGTEHQWIQDERELKRQKRKQSNRESARRSRLRKQAECEELQAKVESLNSENQSLKDELQRLAEERKKLASENNSILEQLNQIYGPDAVSSVLEGDNSNSVLQYVKGEGNSHGEDTSRGNNFVPDQNNGNFFSSNGKPDPAPN